MRRTSAWLAWAKPPAIRSSRRPTRTRPTRKLWDFKRQWEDAKARSLPVWRCVTVAGGESCKATTTAMSAELPIEPTESAGTATKKEGSKKEGSTTEAPKKEASSSAEKTW